MSLYKDDFTDFPSASNKVKPEVETFSVIIHKEVTINNNLTPLSLANAAKPLVYFSSIFGLRMFNYKANNLKKLNVYYKLYCILLIAMKLTMLVMLQPISWRDTKIDLPLNILTKFFSVTNETEIFYCVIITAFVNSPYYVRLFKVLDNIDNHFCLSKKNFQYTRCMSVMYLIVATVYFLCTFFLRKFRISNIGVHLSFYTLMCQSAIISFLVYRLYWKLTMLNCLLVRKVEANIPNSKKLKSHNIKLRRTMFFSTSNLLDESSKKHYCWLELMQIYDKLSDCFYLFNKIFAVQVLIMFGTWLLCTLLIICRSLSPSLKYKELFFSDIFAYTCINLRPFFLAIMCERTVRERNKTKRLLLQILLHGNLDESYYDQVQTMIDLVDTRKLLISTNVISVNIPTVMNFAGRAISYTVLIIQYFYMHSL